MPVTKSAHKALRSSRRKKVYNDRIRKKLSQIVKETIKKTTPAGLKKAYQIIDRAVAKKIIHANRAARIKSRLIKLAPREKVSPKKVLKK